MRDLYEQIITSLTSGVLALDENGVIATVNLAAREYLGVDGTALQPGTRLDAVDSGVPLLAVWDEVRRTHKPIVRYELDVPIATGETKRIGLSASLLEGPKPFNGVILLFTDLTEQRRLERAAELNRQLAALGELTAGVVHELRNPVSVISGMAELIMRKGGLTNDLQQAAQTIVGESAALERSIAQFLGFARPFELQLAHCGPEEIVDRSLQLCKRRAERKNVTIDTAVVSGLPTVRADAFRAAQAVSNVLNNAVDAAPDGGLAVLEVYEEHGDIVFEVSDNGPGITVGPNEDVFAPFVTNKEGGTGLGLSIAHRIITAHNGSIQYTNRPDGGARFKIRIPVVNEKLELERAEEGIGFDLQNRNR